MTRINGSFRCSAQNVKVYQKLDGDQRVSLLALLLENVRLRLQIARLSRNLTEGEKKEAALSAEEYRRKLEKMSAEELEEETKRLRDEKEESRGDGSVWTSFVALSF